ncbi:MAG: hypothetical protein ACRDUV_07775 [Pseudonocardiaceae bacterium]
MTVEFSDTANQAGANQAERPQTSVAAATRTMAVATLVSRITGFVRQLGLAAILGLGVVNDSYTVSNTLPAML